RPMRRPRRPLNSSFNALKIGGNRRRPRRGDEKKFPNSTTSHGNGRISSASSRGFRAAHRGGAVRRARPYWLFLMRTDGLAYGIKSALDRAAVPFFKMRPRPFSPGFQTVRRRIIESAIDNGVLRDSLELPPGYGIAMDERVVEYPWLFGRLKRAGRMLDAGSTFNFDFLLDRPPLKGADLTIMTLAPEKRCYWHAGYSYVFGDLRRTYFADGTFYTDASISPSEHIGLDNTMLYTASAAAAEVDEN